MKRVALDAGTLKDKLFQRGCNCSGFVPKLTYAYDAEAKTVTVTDDSDLPAGDALRHISVLVHDEFGGTKAGGIAALAGNTGALDVSALDASKGLHLTAVVVTTADCKSDGSARNIAAEGELGNWSENYKAELAG